MTKLFKISFLVLLVVGLMAGSAFAGSVQIYGSSSSSTANTLTAAVEALGAAKGFTMTQQGGGCIQGGVVQLGGCPLGITAAVTINVGDVINVSFTSTGANPAVIAPVGAGSTNTFLCVNGALSTPIFGPTGSLAVNQTAINFTSNQTINPGTPMFVTTDPAVTTTCAASNGRLDISLPKTTSAQILGISFRTIPPSSGTPDSGSANFANVVFQESTLYANSTASIDFIGNNGVKFTAGNTANQAVVNLATNYGSITANLGVTNSSAILSLQDTANWAGVNAVWVQNTTGCGAYNGNVTNSAALNGTLNLTIPGNAFNGNSSPGTYTGFLCISVPGNAVITSRTISGSYNVIANGHTADTAVTLETWTPNGYQGIIPYLNTNGTSFNTVCIVNNQGATNASATLDILSAESNTASSETLPTGISLGTIPAKGTVRVDLSSTYTVSNTNGTTETAVLGPTTITGIGASDRYSARLNVYTSPSQVTVNCLLNNGALGPKPTPVYQLNTTTGVLLY